MLAHCFSGPTIGIFRLNFMVREPGAGRVPSQSVHVSSTQSLTSR
jgi:hypothetical protein